MMHLFLAQYIKSSIVYIISLRVDIPILQSSDHHKVNNYQFMILWHQMHVHIPPLGMIVAMVNGSTVRTTWEVLSLLWDVRDLSGTSTVCNGSCFGHSWFDRCTWQWPYPIKKWWFVSEPSHYVHIYSSESLEFGTRNIQPRTAHLLAVSDD
jgi:hypothetical protein